MARYTNGSVMVHVDEYKKHAPAFEVLNFRIGELITITKKTMFAMGTIFRVTKVGVPAKDAIWQDASTKGYRRWMGRGWYLKGKRIPDVRAMGFIEVTETYSFMGKSFSKKHTISSKDCSRYVKRVDIADISMSYAKLQNFIHEELQRVTGE